MKLLKEKIKKKTILTYECYLSHWLYFTSYQLTELFVTDVNINCGNVFCSLLQIRFASRCQVVKLGERYIKVSVVNNTLNMISQQSEHSNETFRHVMFMYT